MEVLIKLVLWCAGIAAGVAAFFYFDNPWLAWGGLIAAIAMMLPIVMMILALFAMGKYG